jgi:4-amino-4-deoxy-L-arabinose transferase-like glycosyltransferase
MSRRCGSLTTAVEKGAMWALLLALILLTVSSTLWWTARWVSDESWYANPGYSLLTEGRIRTSCFGEDIESSAVADTRPPLMPITLAASFRMFGLGVIPARAPSLLAALLALCLTWYLATEWMGGLAGALTALLLALDTYFVVGARTARPEALVACGGILAIFLFYRSSTSWRSLRAFGAGLAAGSAVALHVAGAGYIAAPLTMLWLERGRESWKDRRLYALLGGFLLVLAAFAAWLLQDGAHRADMVNRYLQGGPVVQRLLDERIRWADFLGVPNQRFWLPFPIPFRIHIAALLAAGLIWLWRRERNLSILLGVTAAAVLFSPSVLLNTNKSARYFASVAPVLALILGCALADCLQHFARYRRIVLVALTAVLVTQIAGTAVYLNQCRKADFDHVSRELRRAIPQGESAYGLISFWTAMYDRQYYAYERTPLDYAVTKLKPHYLILYDRVMMHGSGLGGDEQAGLREGVKAFLSKTRHEVVARIPDSYYGDLEVVRIDYPAVGR